MFTRLCPLLGRKKWFIVHPTSSTLKYYFPPINFTRRSVGSVRAVGLVLGAKYGSTTSSKLVQGLFMYSPLLFELVGCVLCAAGGRGGAEAPKCAFFLRGGGHFLRACSRAWDGRVPPPLVASSVEDNATVFAEEMCQAEETLSRF